MGQGLWHKSTSVALIVFSLWIQSDDDDFHFEKRHFDECPEDPVFLEWLCGQPIDSDAFARGSDLHALRPLNP